MPFSVDLNKLLAADGAIDPNFGNEKKWGLKLSPKNKALKIDPVDGSLWWDETSFLPALAAGKDEGQFIFTHFDADKWLLPPTPASSPGFLLSGVGGATVAPSTFPIHNLHYYQCSNLTATTAAELDNFTAPTKYVRIEITNVKPFTNFLSFGLKTRRDLDLAIEVWQMDAAGNAPTKRLAVQTASILGVNAGGNRASLSPSNQHPIENIGWEWNQFLIPQPVLSPTRSMFLAIKVGLLSSTDLQLGGFGLSECSATRPWVSLHARAIHKRVNGLSNGTFSGNLTPGITDGLEWIALGAGAKTIIRMPILPVDKFPRQAIVFVAPCNINGTYWRNPELLLRSYPGTPPSQQFFGRVQAFRGKFAEMIFSDNFIGRSTFCIPIASEWLNKYGQSHPNSALPFLDLEITNREVGTQFLNAIVVEPFP